MPTDNLKDSTIKQRIFGGNVTILEDGDAETFDCRGMSQITIIAGTGATVTYSRVNDETDTDHVTGTENGDTVEANTLLAIPIDWPFFHISVAGGDCRVAMV